MSDHFLSDPYRAEPPRHDVPKAATVTVDLFKQAVGSWATGVTVVTLVDPSGRLHGFTANSFTSVSLDPPYVLVCLQRHSPSLRGFGIGRPFAVNILAAEQQELSGRFARPSEDKFAGLPYRLAEDGAPMLEGCHATLACVLEHWFHGGDHVMLMGRVEEADVADNEPLLFHRSQYKTVHKD